MSMDARPFAKVTLIRLAKTWNASNAGSPYLIAWALLSCFVKASAEGPHPPVASKHSGRYTHPKVLQASVYFLYLACSC